MVGRHQRRRESWLHMACARGHEGIVRTILKRLGPRAPAVDLDGSVPTLSSFLSLFN